MIDAADMGRKPGTVSLIEPGPQCHTVTFLTHKMPPSALTDYLHHEIGCISLIIGIQPQRIDFDAEPTPLICRAARKLASQLMDAMKTV